MSRKHPGPGKRPGQSRSPVSDPPFGAGGDVPYFELESEHVDPARLKHEREKARQLRKTAWWQDKIRRGVCEYCEKKVPPEQLTLDHRVPLARGGRSVPGNVVAACKDCNRSKGLMTPVDAIFQQLEREKQGQGGEGEGEGEGSDEA